MGFEYEERASDSAFVEAIWRTQTDINGSNVVIADGSWDIHIKRDAAGTTAMISGPMSKAVPVPYTQGTEWLGIRLRLGTFMPQLPMSALVNVTVPLRQATGESFWLGEAAWQYPTFEDVEVFVEKLARDGLLARDEVVDAALQEEELYMSVRSVQRRFVRITGMTRYFLHQIERARQAAALLEQGASILDTVQQLGYADQPHLTRSLRQFIGQTPGQIVRMGKP